jgi:hypothetical protein
VEDLGGEVWWVKGGVGEEEGDVKRVEEEWKGKKIFSEGVKRRCTVEWSAIAT